MHYHSKNAKNGAKYKARLEKHFAQYISATGESALF
jgi:hypothetical protein